MGKYYYLQHVDGRFYNGAKTNVEWDKDQMVVFKTLEDAQEAITQCIALDKTVPAIHEFPVMQVML